MASEACPVCCLILNVETPARVALVAKPARRLWPEYPVRVEPCGGHPIANDQGHGFAGKSTGRDPPVSIDGSENGTSSIRAALSQFSSALTGQ